MSTEKIKKITKTYKKWAENHKEVGDVNHDGSVGKMGVDAVVEMIQRSEALHQVKYTHYIGDGDCKTFKHIIDVKLYENVIVPKKEYVDYVKRRMCTNLHNLKKNARGLGGRSKLTGKLIDELSIYYELAFRRNFDLIF